MGHSHHRLLFDLGRDLGPRRISEPWKLFAQCAAVNDSHGPRTRWNTLSEPIRKG